MSEPFWSALQLTKDGFLMIPEKFDQPPLLISAEALWLKFHPHLTQVSFDEPPTIVKSGERKYISDMCNIISPILDDIDKMKEIVRDLWRNTFGLRILTDMYDVTRIRDGDLGDRDTTVCEMRDESTRVTIGDQRKS